VPTVKRFSNETHALPLQSLQIFLSNGSKVQLW
jgi:hypothetical protein